MPYDYLTINEQDLNYGIVSASYFQTNLQSLYEQKTLNEQKFFGDNEDDIVELSIYNANQEPILFNRIIPKVTYSVVQGNYRDINNVPRNFDVKNPFTNYALYNNELLLHTQFDLKVNELYPGLYYMLYNPIRNVAGNSKNRLFIKEISPSRTELRFSFAFNTGTNEASRLDAFKISTFADKKYSFLQLIDELIPIIDDNPISQIFNLNSNSYNYFKYAQLLGLKSTAELQSFINSTYTGYTKTYDDSLDETVVVKNVTQFAGVAQQIKNFIYTYNELEFSENEILESVKLIVAKVSQDAILQKTTLTTEDLTSTVDLFVNIIYTNWLYIKINELLISYREKYYGLYKNAINFDDGNLVKILTHTSYVNSVDNSVNIQVKLDSPLPQQYSLKDTCWISNISLAPIYFKCNLYTAPVSGKVYLNGVNFTVNVDKVTSGAEKYSTNNEDTIFGANVRLKNNINDLLIDYSDFSNFINFSSAELRTKIAKNKINQYINLNSEKNSVALKSATTTNPSISASYSTELNEIVQNQIKLLNTFDDYESYLFYNTSSIDQKINDAIEYDSQNYNSLFYQLPDYLKTDEKNADYLKFTAMVGHMFDNILVFIKKFPKSYDMNYGDNNSYPKNYIEELLNSFGWNVTNVNFNKSRLSQLLFNKSELTGSLSSSYFDYAKSIFSRLTNNLNYIYKTKGTSDSFDLVRTIFGIPADLINVTEYTTPSLLANRNIFYDFDDIIYATKFDSNQYVTCDFTSSDYKLFLTSQWTQNSGSTIGASQITQSYVERFVGVSTIESTFRSDQYKKYDFKDKIPLIKKLRNNKIDWQVYLYKTKQEKSAKLIFETHPYESGYTSSIVSTELPYLNGDFYTFMVRRQPVSSRFDRNAVLTQSNALTHSITSSAVDKYVPYEYSLYVNQYYGSQLNFSDKQTKRISFDQNKYFSSGSYYLGNFSSSTEYFGNLDKFKMFKYPTSDADFNEHSYNLNSISIPEKDLVYENLYYLWSFDTPVNLYSATYFVVDNQNNRYSNKFRAYNFNRKTIERGYPYCDTVSTDIFPYQFEKFDIKQSLNSNKFGPNYKSKATVTKISQDISSNLAYDQYSTYTNDIIGSDTNLIGYYISPYQYLNTKIEDFLGKEGIIDVIGDPKYLTSRYYPELKLKQKEFAKTGLKYVYPQEFFSTYKFYIDFSIFDFVKKLAPARSTLKRGLLLEPSIFERVKFNYKDINVDTTDTANQNVSSVMSYNINAKFTSSLTDTNNTSSNSTIDTTYINYTTSDNDTYNFSRLLINSSVDDRDFIYSKFGKHVYVDQDGYKVRDVINNFTQDYYRITNNMSESICTFTSSYYQIQTIGSGSGGLTSQVTGSRYLKDVYSGSRGSGYSPRHLSKFIKVGTRERKIAISGSRFVINNGVKTVRNGLITYYTYVKGQNTSLTTVNRDGVLNGASPIITIPGFMSVDIESDNFPFYGTLTGSIDNPNSIFVRVPLTCSTCTSASLNNYIMNL